jgi:hypothetical protein
VGELVDDVEQAELASVMGALLEEVVRPDVVGALGSQPNARSVIQPQACPLGLPDGNLQPLASPDPLDPLVVDQPARPTQKLGDLAIAVRPYCRANATMSAVSRSSSSRPRGILRCVERCWPSAAQARRSEIDSTPRTCSMQARRRAGLSSFPGPPPAGSACPGSGPTPLGEAGCSPSRDPSGA